MKSLLLLLLLLGPAFADAACPGLEITHAWLREPPPGAKGTAGYLQIHNTGPSAARLGNWRSERFGMVMLHETVQVGDRSSMRHLDTLDVPPKGVASLAPGGLHLMLMGPSTTLHAGESVEFLVSCGGATLKFPVTVTADGPVQP